MEQKNTIHDILTQREEFLVIGLTGRLGSGCSKVADVLATPFDKMKFPHPIPQYGSRSLTEEERVIRIIAEYAGAHWLKFDVIQASAIIATFILDDDRQFMSDLNNSQKKKAKEHNVCFKKELLAKVYRSIIELYTKSASPDNPLPKISYIAEPQEAEELKAFRSNADYLEIAQGCFAKKVLVEDAYGANRIKELKKLGDQLKKIVDKEDDLLKEYFDSEKYTEYYKTLFTGQNTPEEKPDWEPVADMMNYLYRDIPQKYPKIHRRRFLECVDKLLVLFSIHCMMDMMNSTMQKEDAAAELWRLLQQINQSIAPEKKSNDKVTQIQKFVFAKHIATWFGRFIREYITDSLGDDAYARLFQRYGQMIRVHSCITAYEKNSAAGEVPSEGKEGSKKEDIFAIPRRINEHIKVLRHPFRSRQHRPVRIVVDSIKNVFEAVYLRYRYSAFYLWAITTDPDIREQRLHGKHLTDIQVRMLDWNEYPDKGSEVIAKADKFLKKKELDIKKEEHWEKIRKALVEKMEPAEVDFYLDCLANEPPEQMDEDNLAKWKAYCKDSEEFNCIRREFFRNNTYPFYTQDIDSCVCNADVYLFNNATSETDTENNRKLLEAVVRNVSLVMYPCLVRPTPVERCMQIAFSAKVNSGCLSRQVGAVVTDSQYNILAIGWNDVPCGEVPCAYKNLNDISASADRDAYSEYELHNSDFRKELARFEVAPADLRGLPFSYCFKNVHKDVKDPMRSRAMHAEEKALALCGREAEGGYLFTTSSPCEMCSKNAKNHKIRKVYYLEAYPGISQAQYTNSGDKSNRAELILFSGAVGRAYMQMYTPLLPHKDVLEYLGIRKNKLSAVADGNGINK